MMASTGLPIPVVDVQAARSAALRLRQAAVAADECLDEMAAAWPPDWSGPAGQAYLDGRALVSRRATDLAAACRVLDRAVVGFSEEAAAVLPRWRGSAARLEELERIAADPVLGGLDGAAPARLEALVSERDELQVEVLAWERRFGEAEAALSAACSRVLAIVEGGRLSTGDQLWAIPGTVVQQMVMEPARLAALLWRDPSQVDDVAKSMWFGTIDQITHPRRTAEEMAGLPAYQDGRWGEGVGTGVVSAVGLFGLRRLIMDLDAGVTVQPDGSPTWPPPVGAFPLKKGQRFATTAELVRFRRYIDTRDRSSLITTQTLDELRAAPDLDRSEHPALGHTLSRHVDVTDQYLEFRLREGTPENDGRISAPPTEVSRWTDRATAEATIRRAILDLNTSDLATLTGPGDGIVRTTIGGVDLGEVWRLSDEQSGSERPVLSAPATSATIILVRRRENVFVLTTELRASPAAAWREHP